MTTDLNTGEVNRESSTRPSRREQLFEVSAFLFLIVPSLALSFFAVKQGTLSFVITAIATILRDLALVSLILFFIWRNREAITRIGWSLKNGWRDVVLGVVLFIPFFYGAGLLENILHQAGFSVPSTPTPSFLAAQGITEIILAFVLVVVVAIAEETIFRGYLILRFRGLAASPVVAILLSAFVFSLGHGYEGTAGVVTVGTMGAVFAIIYVWRKSLVAPMVMHFLQDFIGIVLLPLLGMG
jgi:membrane protease YdiL (CAAX protease family)